MTKEELIDFANWYNDQSFKGFIEEEEIDEYLSINSSSSGEALTLGNNEQKEKVVYQCQYCYKNYTYLEDLQIHLLNEH